MAEHTKIAWCDHTFNGWIGCSKVHTGCEHCYAEADMDKRRHRVQWGLHGTRSLTSDANWREPLKWNRKAAWYCPNCGFSGQVAPNADPNFICCGHCGSQVRVNRPRVFCSSLADVFEDWQGPIVDTKGDTLVTDRGRVTHTFTGDDSPSLRMADARRRLFGLIDATPNLDWLLLTKRPENIRRMWPDRTDFESQENALNGGGTLLTYRQNVWLGTSISDQATADKAIPELLECRDLSPVLFLSVEPLVGPVDLGPILREDGTAFAPLGEERTIDCGGCLGTPVAAGHPGGQQPYCPGHDAGGIDWVIVGGESGPNARPCDISWIEDIVEQCAAAGVPCFVKQLGSWPAAIAPVLNDWPEHVEWRACSDHVGFRLNGLRDKKGGDPAEWPEHLRVQQFPEVTP